MLRKVPKSTLSMECSEWAASFAQKSTADADTLQFYAFKPNIVALPGASFLGKFTDSNLKPFDTKPAWQWHVAVEWNGLMYDEIHSNGIDVEKYLNFFESIRYIIVTVHEDLPSAVESANSWLSQ